MLEGLGEELCGLSKVKKNEQKRVCYIGGGGCSVDELVVEQ
jgi:hypothetical protein